MPFSGSVNVNSADSGAGAGIDLSLDWMQPAYESTTVLESEGG